MIQMNSSLFLGKLRCLDRLTQEWTMQVVPHLPLMLAKHFPELPPEPTLTCLRRQLPLFH
jgi:hypothetical protein